MGETLKSAGINRVESYDRVERLEKAAESLYQQQEVRPLGATLGATLGGPHCRQSARSYLQSRAASLRAEADRMERLAMALPLEMHPVADEALWDLISRGAR